MTNVNVNALNRARVALKSARTISIKIIQSVDANVLEFCYAASRNTSTHIVVLANATPRHVFQDISKVIQLADA
jgi:hypothetical protein